MAQTSNIPVTAQGVGGFSRTIRGRIFKETIDVFRTSPMVMAALPVGQAFLPPTTTAPAIPYESVPVQLLDNQGRILGSTNTNKFGQFEFQTSFLGNLRIRFERTRSEDDVLLTLANNDVHNFTLTGGSTKTVVLMAPAITGQPAGSPPVPALPAGAFLYRFTPGTISGRVTDGNRGLAGVNPIVVYQECFGVVLEFPVQQTSALGVYQLAGLPPGNATVVIPSRVVIKSQQWELNGGGDGQFDVQVVSGEISETQDSTFQVESHSIRHTAINAHGIPAAGVRVRVTGTGANSNYLEEFVSDQGGITHFEVPAPGEYLVVSRAPGAGVSISRRVMVNSCCEVEEVVATAEPGNFHPSNGHHPPPPENPIENNFPFLTAPIDIGSASQAPSNGSGGNGHGSLSDAAIKAISQTLGWKFKAGDHKGFSNALKQRFDLQEIEGHVEWTYKPGNYLLASDLSADKPITGAQASLLAQMRNATDHGKELLDGLYPLRQLADDQDGPALKSLIEQLMDRLVEEMATPGGPRIPLVDSLFEQLVGPTKPTVPTNGDDVKGALGTLRVEFGLSFVNGNLVNTVDEEVNLTSFRILVDYMLSVFGSWIANKASFSQTSSNPFFGTQLVHISRQLSVVSAEVEQVRTMLDSVFLDQSERLTTRIPLTTFPSDVNLKLQKGSQIYLSKELGLSYDLSMLVEELLNWTQVFASEEGPDQVENGGKYGVQNHFLPEAVRLRNLVYAATNKAVVKAPPAFVTARVQTALLGLGSQLDEVAALADGLKYKIPAQGNGNGAMSYRNGGLLQEAITQSQSNIPTNNNTMNNKKLVR